MSGSGISWAICKPAPRSRQTTTPTVNLKKITVFTCLSGQGYLRNNVSICVDQAGFRRGLQVLRHGCSTWDQVTALTTFIENGFEKILKTGVFLPNCCIRDHLAHWLPLSTVQVPAFLVHSDSGTAAAKPPFPGPCGRRCHFLAKAGKEFAPGLCPTPTLFSLHTNDLPVTHSHKVICADDICCAETFSEIECTLTVDTADLAHLAKHCQLWRLKPGMSKAVTSVFHLHNNRSRCELNVHMDGQRLKHDLYPVYLDFTRSDPFIQGTAVM